MLPIGRDCNLGGCPSSRSPALDVVERAGVRNRQNQRPPLSRVAGQAGALQLSGLRSICRTVARIGRLPVPLMLGDPVVGHRVAPRYGDRTVRNHLSALPAPVGPLVPAGPERYDPGL